MKTLTLIRSDRDTEQGTFGSLFDGRERIAVTAEPPWRDNRRNFSCIPAGDYLCHWHHSPKYGMCFEVSGVPDRSRVLIHSGNVAGDREKGLTTHSWGCLLLGSRKGKLRIAGRYQTAVLASRYTITRFHRRMAGHDFTLRILEV